jgi:AcrR family transcriptional regulator
LSPRPQIDHIRRPQILGAAAEVIAERGVSATRIADVAARAGTSSAAILYWFGSKDRLLAEALTFEEERFYADLDQRLAALERPRDRLLLLIESAVGGADWWLWMELWTRALRDAELGKARKELDDKWRSHIADIVRDGQAAGEFGAVDPDDAAVTLASLIDGLAVQDAFGDPAVADGRMRQLAIRTAELLLECELEPEAVGG